MIVGIDFDNTMVDYTGVFHSTALTLGWFNGAEVARSKDAVKAFFIEKNLEDKWTELQGIVYGKTISQAKPYAGLLPCLRLWLEHGHQLFIISHKTQYPIIGARLNFHDAALDWLKTHIFSKLDQRLFNSHNVYFNQTICEKIATIGSLNCDLFIDDLEKILLDPSFPGKTQKILFDPNSLSEQQNALHTVSGWDQIYSLGNAFDCR